MDQKDQFLVTDDEWDIDGTPAYFDIPMTLLIKDFKLNNSIVKLHNSILTERRYQLMKIDDILKLREYNRMVDFKYQYPTKKKTEEHISNIEKLLWEYGQISPCIVACWHVESSHTRWEGIMVEGCHRVISAKRLGWTHLAVHFDATTRCPCHNKLHKILPGLLDDRGHPRPYPKLHC